MLLVDGVTTNPSLAAKENTEFRPLVKQIRDLVQGPVSAEVVATQADEMFAEARELAAISPHVVVKLPTIPEGIKALARCVEAGIPINRTLVFQPIQALVVAKVSSQGRRHVRQPVPRPPG